MSQAYPNNVPGQCDAFGGGKSSVFDCTGDGSQCVPFSVVRDCIKDCDNGRDEGAMRARMMNDHDDD